MGFLFLLDNYSEKVFVYGLARKKGGSEFSHRWIILLH